MPPLRRLVVFLGGGLVLASLLLPWFQVPVGLSELVIGGREPRAVLLFKALCSSVVFFLVVRRPGRRDQRGTAMGGAALFAALLFFPHAVMVWCPNTSGRASWLHTLHESLTWFGGDLFGLQEAKQSSWRGNVVVADVLDQATSMNVPTWGPGAMPFGSLRGLAEWFGYSNSFCQFARVGWGVSLFGAFLLAAGSVRREDGADPDTLRAGAGIAALVLAAGGAAALLPAAFCATELDRSRSAAERGQYELALERMDTAAWIAPVLDQTSELVLERGLLEARLGRDSPAAALYRAKVLQGAGRFEEAESLLGALLVSGVQGALGRESARGLLRRGIRQLNSGQTTAAIETLQAVMRADPCDIKANYVLQLAYLRAARFDELQELAANMSATYRFFRDETKFAVLAATQENVAYSQYLRDDAQGAAATLQAVGDPKKLEP